MTKDDDKESDDPSSSSNPLEDVFDAGSEVAGEAMGAMLDPFDTDEDGDESISDDGDEDTDDGAENEGDQDPTRIRKMTMTVTGVTMTTAGTMMETMIAATTIAATTMTVTTMAVTNKGAAIDSQPGRDRRPLE